MRKEHIAGPPSQAILGTRSKWWIAYSASLVGGLQASTQVFAHRFGYQDALGVSFSHLYAPWSILNWAAKWYNLYPIEFTNAGSIGSLVFGIGLFALSIAKAVARNTGKANKYLHGSARWAEKKDIQKAGLLPRKRSIPLLKDSVYVGGWQDEHGKLHYLRHSGPEHVLTYAPTRSGKGVGLVIPTLLSWGASAVITDIKGELWALTAGWRQKHAQNKVLRFEPATLEGSVCWNPLDEIRLGTEYEVGDAQNIANLIADPHGKGLKSHWDQTASSLLAGVILHALYKAKNGDSDRATMAGIDAMLANPLQESGELWQEMATYKHVAGQNHQAVSLGARAARDMMDRPDEEAGSVLSTAKRHLALYRDPVVAHNTSCSEFHIRDLMHHTNPVSLYIVTQTSDQDRLMPLVRILLTMVVRILADKLDFKDGRPVAHYKHRLLMLLDEFPSFGKLKILQKALAYLAGFGIKCYLFCQDLNQLKDPETGYGPNETITSNCHIQNAYPPNRLDTAEHLSRLTGQTTIVNEHITTSGKRTAAMLGQVSRTFQEVQRPLLTPDECLRMTGPEKNGELIKKAGDMVVYIAGYPAIYGKQILYFQDPIFQARAAISAPKVSDKLYQFPDKKISI